MRASANLISRWEHLADRLNPWERRFVVPFGAGCPGATRWSDLLVAETSSVESEASQLQCDRLSEDDFAELAAMDSFESANALTPPCRYEETLQQLEVLSRTTDVLRRSLAVRSDGLVASVLAVTLSPGAVWVVFLKVRQDLRRCGLARGLVAAVAEEVSPGCSLLACVSTFNTPAQSLFKGLGFRHWGRVAFVPSYLSGLAPARGVI